METEGHPTQDLVEELQRRGGLLHPGTSTGPDDEALEFARRGGVAEPGVWLFLPNSAYDTAIDERPPQL